MKKEITTQTINKNCFIYVRVSTTRQADEGFSLDAQIKVCAEYAKKRGLSIKEIFREEGETATASERPEFLEMISRCEEAEVGAVIVYLTDRFARNKVDHHLIKDKLKKCGVELLSANQEMLNGNTPEAGLMDGIMASINEFYSQDNSRKTKKGMMQKFEEGVYPGWAPQGYKHVIDGMTKKHIIEIDSDTAPLVRLAFELYAQGTYSIFSLSEELDVLGLRGRKGNKLCESSLQILLTNSYYWGLMRWKGKEKMGTHIPIIEKPLFDKVQYLLARHRDFLIRERKYNFLLRGLIRCEVHDRRLVAEWHKVNSKMRDKVAYYHCCENLGCQGTYVRQEYLENAVAELFKHLQFKQEFINLVVQEAKDYLINVQNNNQGKKTNIENKIKGFENKRNKLEDLLIEGAIDRDTYNRQHSIIQRDIDVSYRKIIDVERERGIDIKIIEEILYLSKNIYSNYISVPPELKRRYIMLFFEKITVKDKRISQIVYRPLFADLLEQQTEVILRANWLPRLDSDQ